MKDSADRQSGRRLIHAVERLLDDPEELVALADRILAQVHEAEPGAGEHAVRDLAAERIIRHFAARTAWSGGATALPALLPGAGTLLALTGGSLVDVALTLKFETEMALALSWVYGFDIRLDEERRLALLLASVSVHDAQTGGDVLGDLASVEGEALWRYGPRQVPKLLLQVASRLAFRTAAKGLGRALPVVGIAVGAATNRVLTERVGRRCLEAVQRRQAEQGAADPGADVVDAVIVEARPPRARPAKGGAR
jgi:hypothetical protein